LHLIVADSEKARAVVKEKLESQGITVIRLDSIVPSLEDVFVTLTAGDRNKK
jgi:hypothetical protein